MPQSIIKSFKPLSFDRSFSIDSDQVVFVGFVWSQFCPILIIYYKPRPRNYRVLHRALYNPRPQYLNFFDYSFPSLKPSQSLSFEEEKAVERKIAFFSSFFRRLWRQVALPDEVWPTEACATTLSRHWISLSLCLALSHSFFRKRKRFGG